MRALRTSLAAIGAVLAISATGAVASASPAATPTATSSPSAVTEALDTFPYRHMSISDQAANDPYTPRPGYFWVLVDDGSANPEHYSGRSVPRDGSRLDDAASNDPNLCEYTGTVKGTCFLYWATAGDEVRVFTTWHDQSCVLIGSTVRGTPTRLNCEGVTRIL